MSRFTFTTRYSSIKLHLIGEIFSAFVTMICNGYAILVMQLGPVVTCQLMCVSVCVWTLALRVTWKRRQLTLLEHRDRGRPRRFALRVYCAEHWTAQSNAGWWSENRTRTTARYCHRAWFHVCWPLRPLVWHLLEHYDSLKYLSLIWLIEHGLAWTVVSHWGVRTFLHFI